jgi:hypothetical protein
MDKEYIAHILNLTANCVEQNCNRDCCSCSYGDMPEEDVAEVLRAAASILGESENAGPTALDESAKHWVKNWREFTGRTVSND